MSTSKPTMAETTNTLSPLPKAESAVASDLSTLHSGVVDNILTQALPLPDLVFGGAMLVLVIMFHAICMRFITGAVIGRFVAIRSRPSLWRADSVFALTVFAVLAVHLSEVLLWSSALVVSHIVDDWARAAYFAANCYTALGEPFSLPHAWRMLPPIIAISGIFTFAWTASVLVDFVSHYNELRAEILTRHQGQSADHPHNP